MGRALGIRNGMLPLNRCDDPIHGPPVPCRAGGSAMAVELSASDQKLSAMVFYATIFGGHRNGLVMEGEHRARMQYLATSFDTCQREQPRLMNSLAQQAISLSGMAGCIHSNYPGNRSGRIGKLRGIAVFVSYNGEGFGIDFGGGRLYYDCTPEILVLGLQSSGLRVCFAAIMSESKM